MPEHSDSESHRTGSLPNSGKHSKSWATSRFCETHCLNVQAEFELSKPIDISSIPDSGEWANIEIPGRMTIRGVTNDVTVTMKAARTEDLVLLSGALPINRLDYNVRLPQFVAATIQESGELNLRIVAQKDKEGLE